MDDSSEGWYTQEIAELLGYSYVWRFCAVCLLPQSFLADTYSAWE